MRAPNQVQQKARRRVAAQTSARQKNGGHKMRSAPRAAVGAPMPTGIQETRLTAIQTPARPVSAPEVIAPPRPPEPFEKPKRIIPLLCPPCRRLGYANCPRCTLATDSSMAVEGGVPCRVRPPTEQDLWPWHRCEHCDNCFKAPRFPVQRICPDCIANGARR
jgi:hypothetical protein